MLNRRKFVLTAAGSAVAGLSGCLGFLTGEDPLELEAGPSSTSQEALTETEYEFEGFNEVVIEREFEAAGQSREVVVTNVQAEYEKGIDMGPLGNQRGAVFTALTTPQVNVLGQEFNPVAEMSTGELAEMIQDQYEDIRNLEHQEDTEITINGETTTQSKFRARGTLVGDVVDIHLHVSKAVEMGDDLAITVGGYPELALGEEENILTLMRSVRPGE